MKRGFGKIKLSIAAIVCACALSSLASAETIDLTSRGSSGTINGAHFFWTNAHPTGSGVIQSFLRIGSNSDVIQGYNTDAKKFQFDEKPGNFTHSLLLSDIPQVNGFYQFLLDINQRSSSPDSLLSMHELLFFQGNKPDVNQFNPATKKFKSDPSALKTWDLDDGGDNVVEMDYSLNPGSGWGDVMVYVPVSLFNGIGKYLYLYSAFGIPHPNNAGFEEWAILGPGSKIEGGPVPQAAPIPTTAAGGLMLLAAIGVGNARRRFSA